MHDVKLFITCSAINCTWSAYFDRSSSGAFILIDSLDFMPAIICKFNDPWSSNELLAHTHTSTRPLGKCKSILLRISHANGTVVADFLRAAGKSLPPITCIDSTNICLLLKYGIRLHLHLERHVNSWRRIAINSNENVRQIGFSPLGYNVMLRNVNIFCAILLFGNVKLESSPRWIDQCLDTLLLGNASVMLKDG